MKSALDLIFTDASPVGIKNTILKLKNEERNRALSVWACHFGFDELSPKTNEMVIPQDLKAYRDAKKSDRKMPVSNDFWIREDIAAYLTQESFIETQNRTNREWLDILLTWLDPIKDAGYITMVSERIGEFKRFSQVGERMPYKYRQVEQDDEVDMARDMFQGTTV